ASVVASPCTMPFMGPALAFALTQNAAVNLTVFAALGLGMALPFLLLSWVPALAALMPKPGHWMLTFKKIMALPLYATVLWLLWVLSRQVAPVGLLAVIISAAVLALLAMAAQRSRVRGSRRYPLFLGAAWASAVVILALMLSPWLATGSYGEQEESDLYE